jgi:hypothetical protein
MNGNGHKWIQKEKYLKNVLMVHVGMMVYHILNKPHISSSMEDAIKKYHYQILTFLIVIHGFGEKSSQWNSLQQDIIMLYVKQKEKKHIFSVDLKKNVIDV